MSTLPKSMTIRISSITCCHQGCGLVFAVPTWWEEKRREDHAWWYCPNGHLQHYSGESDLERERRLRKSAQDSSDWYEKRLTKEENSHRATKGHLTRAKKRAAHGVCPCCQRSFSNVQRHMERQHPDYVEENG